MNQKERGTMEWMAPHRRRRTHRRTLALALAGALVGGTLATAGADAAPARAQECPAAGNPQADRGWTAGVYDSLRVVTNRRRFGRDGTEFPGLGYDRGILWPGGPPDGLWERGDGVLEVRIPWMLLNFTDPGERRVLQDPDGQIPGEFGTTTVEGIRILAAARNGSTWRQWPASGRAADVASFTWPTWEAPRWRERRRPVFDAMRETYRAIRPTVLRGGGR